MKNQMGKLKAMIMGCCLLLGLFIILPFKSFGAAARITFSDPSVTVGSNVSVTMTVESTDGSPLGSVDVMLNYDPSLLEFQGGDNANGGAGSIKVVGFTTSSSNTSMSFTLNFNAMAAGTAVVGVTNYEVYSFNEELMSMDRVGNSAVAIQAPATYSSEALLASLAVSPGAISPAFAPETTAYSMSVGADVERVVVSANASHAGARVSVSGNTGLTAGTNTITCRVTAEDNQTVKTYTIAVTKAQGEPTEAETEEETTEEIQPTDMAININGAAYQFGGLTEETAVPEGFSPDVYEYEGQTVSALRGTENGLILFYLVDDAGNGGFFVYDEGANDFYEYQTIDIDRKKYVLIPVAADGLYIPDGFERDYIIIRERTVEGWVLTGDLSREFCLFYGMNESGEKNLYVFDFVEETIQRYLEWDVEETAENQDLIDLQQDFNHLTDEYNSLLNITLALGVAAVILLILLVNVFIFKGRKKGRPEEHDEDDLEDALLELAPTMEAADGAAVEPASGETDGEAEPAKVQVEATAIADKSQSLSQSEEGAADSGSADVAKETGPVDIDQLADLLRGFDIDDLEKAEIKEKQKEEKQPEEDLEDDDFEFFDLDD